MNDINKVNKAIEKLKIEGGKFTSKNYTDREDTSEWGGEPNGKWETWRKRIKSILNQIVKEGSEPYTYYEAGQNVKLKGYSISNFEIAKSNYLKSLESLENILIEGDFFQELLNNDIVNSKKTESKTSIVKPANNKVFIVHGHDHILKVELEIFLSKLKLNPIVLHRESDKGQTIIEKFEANSDVSFVFVLLTPDEVAYTADQLEKEDENRKKEFRARPNVIFEFGYFIGKLGRRKVCALHKGNVNLPSDISGVIYKKVDNSIEDIGFGLIKELKAAGLTITI